MYDVTFCVILVTTLLAGYYRRDELNAQYLERYNDEFPQQDEIQAGLDRVFDFIESCEFAPRCRVWKQTDLFTMIVELYSSLVTRREQLDAKAVGKMLQSFFDEVDDLFASAGTADAGGQEVSRYLKAATKASNDKYARVERAEVISALLASTGPKKLAPDPQPTSKKKSKAKDEVAIDAGGDTATTAPVPSKGKRARKDAADGAPPVTREAESKKRKSAPKKRAKPTAA